jgi:hypothetical protein
MQQTNNKMITSQVNSIKSNVFGSRFGDCSKQLIVSESKAESFQLFQPGANAIKNSTDVIYEFS